MDCEDDSPQIGDRNIVVTDLCLLDLGVGRCAAICQKENLLRKKVIKKLMFMPLLFKVLFLIVMECEGRQLEFHVVCVEGEPETPL